MDHDTISHMEYQKASNKYRFSSNLQVHDTSEKFHCAVAGCAIWFHMLS
ncbi:hypothetical protein T05_9572 [Trichinella murrelli]|uniref:Uncharacterized protein n=1 Tax=Trichinella murrelli TaxID=144512 RepID=A0A0V0T1Z4_9BILA|nr:hypothetical protein T05_9572 [Trichinella murrelli]